MGAEPREGHSCFSFSVVSPFEVCIYSTLERCLADAFAATKPWPLRSVRDSSALLAHGLKQHNRNRCSQVQVSRPMHGDSDAVINVRGK